MIWRVRRVITGHDADGKSIFIADGEAPNVKEMGSGSGLAITELWETDRTPASNAGSADAGNRKPRLEPAQNGTVFRIVEFPPDTQWQSRADARKWAEAIDASHAPDRTSSDPMMHKTSTVDYIIVLKGEIYAILDKGEKLLRAGDVFVQRGTNHSWSVRSNEACVIGVVLVDARPVGAKKTKTKRAAKRKTAKKAAKKKK
ncbi:MAG: cupin domain-containing protein [Betaproteobacteria bacterium]|nr:MAG: cupin domain-containing protein [Betaproteobacteria bacterium]